MSDITAISWTDRTWNPWQGCTKVSDGCKFCYMYRDKARYGQDATVVVRSAPATFNRPLAKSKGAWTWPDGDDVFTASWSDIFHTDADAWRADFWAIVKARPGLRFFIVTKRPENIAARLPADWGDGYPNVVLLVSVESGAHMGRAATLRTIPAAGRGISAEPLLGSLLTQPLNWMVISQMDWIIVGGESGAHARPMHPTWAREIRDVATEYGVPFHFKQWGEYEPLGWSCTILDEPESGPGPCRITLGDGYLVAAPERAGWSWSDETYSVRTGKATAGRMLDGRTHDDRPRVCRVAP